MTNPLDRIDPTDREKLEKCVGGLTIKDPWAQAIIHGPKRIENRSKRPPEKCIGEWVAIHCGKSVDDYAWGTMTAYRGSKTNNPPPIEECHPLVQYGYGEGVEKYTARHHPGHIIGVVRIGGWYSADDYHHDARNGLGHEWAMRLKREGAPWPDDIRKVVMSDPWWQGPVGWLLDNPTPLDTPVPARGQLGVWGLEKQIAKEVES